MEDDIEKIYINKDILKAKKWYLENAKKWRSPADDYSGWVKEDFDKFGPLDNDKYPDCEPEPKCNKNIREETLEDIYELEEKLKAEAECLEENEAILRKKADKLEKKEAEIKEKEKDLSDEIKRVEEEKKRLEELSRQLKEREEAIGKEEFKKSEMGDLMG